MLCERCKMREATVRYVEVINGVKNEHNLCAHCAGRMDLGQYTALFEGEFSLGRLLSGLLGIQNQDDGEEKYADVVCPSCKTTYADFVKESRFGCADCYSVFDPLISENIRHLQGSERHVGKRPGSYEEKAARGKESGGNDGKDPSDALVRTLTKEETVRLLQARIKDAVRREDFEEAAGLRDEIRSLKEETRRDEKMV